jgi:hypothetical protein
MKRELGLLNLICLLVALGFLVMAIISVLNSGAFLTIDNLFIIAVSLMMALVFAINPLLYFRSEGRMRLPFEKKTHGDIAPAGDWGQVKSAPAKPLLDAKGRAVPPDVRAIVNRLGPQEGTKGT